MGQALAPFAENGAFFGQILIAVGVVLALVGFGYWAALRFPRLRLGRSRTRGARLAVIDSLPVDGRRQLILLRRDNIEHLILVGGPADVVIEPSIQRIRQRQPAPPRTAQTPLPAAPPRPAAATAPPTEARPRPEAAGEDGPPLIPFPFPRPAPAKAEAEAAAAAAPRGAARGEALRRPVWPSASATAFAPPTEPQPRTSAPDAERPAPAASDTAAPPAPLAATEAPSRPRGSEAPPAPPTALESPAETVDAIKVADLEAEMTRLLGQLAGDRRAS
jgi:flagellar protein FliO/FliZ